ncbi:MAG: VTT domain-containing protein [Chloroflexota bacterium]|nr:VTT domain-containing protein [Chloroflexota bacterium]
MEIFAQLMTYLETLANQIPLEAFTFLGTILEEILAPIPSPFVMTITGSIARAQGHLLGYLIVVALIGALGRVVGTTFLYFVADIAQDIIFGRFGEFLGIADWQFEQIGSRFDGTARDYLTLIILRSIPVMPSSPLSVICGLIKLDFKVFAIGTAVGSVFRNLFFLWIGFTGLAATESFMHGLESAETVVQILFVLALVAGFYYFYRKRERGELLKPVNGPEESSAGGRVSPALNPDGDQPS